MVTTSLTTLGNGISSFTAQNLGAAKPERIKAGFAAGLRLVFAICVPLVLLYFFAGRQLVYVFLESPTGTAADIGMRFLRIISPFYLIVAAKRVADGVLACMAHRLDDCNRAVAHFLRHGRLEKIR